MKRIALILLFLVLLPLNSLFSDLLYKIPTTEKIQNSVLVIEGKCIDKFSFYQPTNDYIYTVHEILPYKSFKGNPGDDNIFIITKGGTIDDYKIVVRPEAKIDSGDVGIFMLINNDVKNPESPVKLTYSCYGTSHGFIKYDLINKTAHCPFYSYTSIPSLIDTIASLAQSNVNHIRDYDFYFNTQKKSTKGDKTLVEITSFSPTTTNAGTRSTITINGSDFGTSEGTLRFKNADYGGSSYMNCPSDDIISWSNTQISARVPSDAGSGNIQVVTSGGASATSSSELTINYCILTVNTYPTHLIGSNSSGGYTFQFASNMINNSSAVNAVLRAVNTWRCSTFVNFDISMTPTSVSCDARDGINVIAFSSASCSVSSGTLGVSTQYWSGCSGNNWYLEDTDLVFNSNISWNYGPGSTPNNQYDFQSTVLHEFGHSHQLGHSNNTLDVMYYSSGTGDETRSLRSISDEAGGDWMVSRSTSNSVCSNSAMSSVSSGTCQLSFVPDADFSASQTEGCAPFTVNFSDNSENDPISWQWDIDNDGDVDYTSENPTHTYTTPGTYTVKLTVSNTNGSDDETKSGYITVHPKPNASISGNTSVCRNKEASFSSNSSTGISNQWSVSGGYIQGPSNEQDVIAVWSSTQTTGSIQLILTNDDTNCKDTVTQSINILASPEPQISGSNVVCQDNEHNYSGNASNGVTSYWEAQNGTISSGQGTNNVSVVWYQEPAKLSLIQTNTTTNCSDTANVNITVNDLPDVAITGNTNPCETNKETYQSIINMSLSNQWYVSGGTIDGASDDEEVDIIWGDSGSGTITCIKTNTSTGCVDSTTINISINDLPTVEITGPESVCENSEITYTANDLAGSTNQWRVEGGNIIVQPNANQLTVQWGETGSGKVVLRKILSTTGCVDSTSIDVTINPLPIVEINGDESVCEDNIYTYSAENSDNLDHKWIVEGGIIQGDDNSSEIDILWGESGNGAIKLIQTHQTTDCNDSASIDIIINPLPLPEIIGEDDVCENSEVTYQAPVYTNINYSWDAEGGNIIGSSEAQQISVLWDKAGQWSLRLVMTDSQTSCSDSVDIPITVNDLPEAEIDGPSTVCENVEYTYTSVYDAQSYNWIASGGQIIGSNIAKIVKVVFNNNGNSSITLELESEDGCKIELTEQIDVNPTPEPEISGAAQVCSDCLEIYSTTGLPDATNNWTIEGGTINNQINNDKIEVRWGKIGSGKILLSQTFTSTGCSGNAELLVTINDAPTTSITGKFNVCEQSTETYTTSSNQEIINEWTVGGGTINGSNTESSINVTWNGAGTGIVGLRQQIPSKGYDETVTENVAINNLPNVQCNLSSEVCVDDEPFEITCGIPEGGIYSGPGISGNVFSPSIAGAGEHTIDYEYTDENGCSGTANGYIHVYPIPAKPSISKDGSTLISSADDGNQWYYEGNAISGAIQKTYEAQDFGEYTVIVTNQGGCSSEMSDPFNFTSSIDETVLSEKIKIHPNPADETATIEIIGFELNNYELIIVDSFGREIIRKISQNDKIKLSTSDFISGTYLVMLQIKNVRYYNKLIIAH